MPEVRSSMREICERIRFIIRVISGVGYAWREGVQRSVIQ